MTAELKTADRVIRVFVSSTFRDMMADRDRLVKYTFPVLRKLCESRGVTWAEVDLRWGITPEESAEGKVLPLCLEEIQRCRPYFIGLLGEQYGSLAQNISADLMARQPWLREHRRRSITELEIIHGVLSQKHMNLRGYFYFRHSGYLWQLPPGSKLRDFISESREAADKLNHLKKRIQDSSSKGICRLRKNYRSPEELGEWILEDLTNLINRLYPEDEKPDPIDRERLDHEAIALNHAKAYIDRQKYFNCLDRYVFGASNPDDGHHRDLDPEPENHEPRISNPDDRSNNPLVLTGKSGIGKSALLANWFLRRFRIKKNTDSALAAADANQIGRVTPEFPDVSNTFALIHFIGATAESADPILLLRRIMLEFKNKFSHLIDSDVPLGPEEIRNEFPKWLDRISSTNKIILVLDGLNQLEELQGSADLAWLQLRFPNNCHVIVSTTSGPSLEATQLRGWPSLDIKSLKVPERKKILIKFLDQFSKRLDPEVTEKIVQVEQTANPLFLRVMLDELRQTGEHMRLDERIRQYLGASGPDELYKLILKRWQQDYGAALVSQSLTFIAAARRGLSEAEILDLLGRQTQPPEPLPRVKWTPFFLAVESSMVTCSGLLTFAHNFLREAVVADLMPKPADTAMVHRKLSNYFRHRAESGKNEVWNMDARALSELPFHLACAGRNEDVAEIFSSLPYLASRIAVGQAHAQLDDFALTGDPLPPAVSQWHGFLRKHAQRLVQHPQMLIALAHHEDFADTRSQVKTIQWPHPWLQTLPAPMPKTNAPDGAGFRAAVHGGLQFPVGSVATIAFKRKLVFRSDRLGKVRVIDADSMQQTETVLPIRRERPLVFSCSPDAESFLVFYDSAEAELYQCIFDKNNQPAVLNLQCAFEYLLPDYEDPVVAWHQDFFWFQKDPHTLARISLDNGNVIEDPLPSGQTGELAALVFTDSNRLVGLRSNGDTILLASGAEAVRRNGVDICAACKCGPDDAAVSFTDGELIIYDLDSLKNRHQLRIGLLRGAMGWDGAMLLWLAEDNNFFACGPAETSPSVINNSDEIISEGLHVMPYCWSSLSDGSMLLLSSHNLVSFRIQSGQTASGGKIIDLFGGRNWRAVVKRQNEHLLVDSDTMRETLLWRDALGRLFCTPAGSDKLFAISGYGPGLMLDLETMDTSQVDNCPMGVNLVTGEQRGGCWMVDRAGDIYFTNDQGQTRLIEKIQLPEVSGARLYGCGESLVWFGNTTYSFPDSAAEAARTFVFFNKSKDRPLRIRRIGQQFIHPREGLCTAVCYDSFHDRLVTLWKKEGEEGYLLRSGCLDDFAAWRVAQQDIVGFGGSGFTNAIISENGEYLGILNLAGEFSCLRIKDGRVLATLAGSLHFTLAAPASGEGAFWLSDSQSKIYHCQLRG